MNPPQAHVTDLAEADLREIWLYVAQDNPDAADRLVARLHDKCHVLAQSPQIGPLRNELKAGLRTFPVGNYLIFYRPTEDGIEVVRVLSGYRDLDRLFPS